MRRTVHILDIVTAPQNIGQRATRNDLRLGQRLIERTRRTRRLKTDPDETLVQTNITVTLITPDRMAGVIRGMLVSYYPVDFTITINQVIVRLVSPDILQ